MIDVHVEDVGCWSASLFAIHGKRIEPRNRFVEEAKWNLDINSVRTLLNARKNE